MKAIKILIHLVTIVLLIVLGFTYVKYIKLEANLLWIPGFFIFFAICFNWYFYSKLFNKLSKDKKKKT